MIGFRSGLFRAKTNDENLRAKLHSSSFNALLFVLLLPLSRERNSLLFAHIVFPLVPLSRNLRFPLKQA